VLEQVLGLGVDLELAGLGEVEGRHLGHVLILALALLLLQLERDAADGAALDALHQVRGVAGNLQKEKVKHVSHSIINPSILNLPREPQE
jgi:hypothetical protein